MKPSLSATTLYVSLCQSRRNIVFGLAAICLGMFPGALPSAAQTAAPSSYNAYTGTDVKPIPAAPTLGVANSISTDPTFGSRVLRVTDANTKGGESFISTDSGFSRTWNSNSTAIKLTGPAGDGYWLEFNPGTFQVGTGSSEPALHAVSFGATWEWSAVQPNIIYYLSGSSIETYNTTTGVSSPVASTPTGEPVAYMAAVVGQDNWICAAAGAGAQDTYTKIFCVNPASPATAKFIDIANATVNGVAQTSANWPTSAAGETIGIHDISGGTGQNWLEITFHQQSWGANGGAVLDLSTNTWSLVTNADSYWSGHVSMGNGKYENASGSINGKDSRGIVVRNPDNLMNSSDYVYVMQPVAPWNSWCDADHSSWLNSLTNPNAPILDSRYSGSSACQNPWSDEIVAAAVDGSNTVWRFAHNFNGGSQCYYAQAFAQISNDGNWALFSSYWGGTLGPDTSFGCTTRIDTFIVDLRDANGPSGSTGTSSSTSNSGTSTSTSTSTSTGTTTSSGTSTTSGSTSTDTGTTTSTSSSGSTTNTGTSGTTTTSTSSGSTTTTSGTSTSTATSNTSAASAGITQSSSSAVAYSQGWYKVSNSAFSGGSAVEAMNAGSQASFTFAGTAVSWIGYSDQWSGIALVSVDGGPAVTVDTYSATQQAQDVEYSVNNLSNATHTLTITATGQQNAAASGAWVWINAFNVSSTASNTATPVVSAVVNAANGGADVAPGSLISIYGSQLASSNGAATATPLPNQLAGVTVAVNGIAAPLIYVSAGQINAQLPFGVAAGTASLTVTFNGSTSVPATFAVAATAPEIFRFAGSQPVAVNQNQTINGPSAPAATGSVITVYLTGQAAVNYAVPTGAAAPIAPLARPVAPVTATLDGQSIDVAFLGLAPDLVGVSQANLQIPNVASGNHSLAIQIGNATSQAVTITVQ